MLSTSQIGEESIKRVLEDSPDGFIVLDKSMRFRYLNKAAFKYMNGSADLGQKVSSQFSQVVAPGFTLKFRQVVESNSPQHAEIYSRVLSKWLSIDIRPMKEVVTVYVRDITKQKQTGLALKRSEKHFRQLLESTGEGIYGIDNSYNCTFINKAGAKLLGYSVREVLGKNMHDLIHHSHENGSPYSSESCPVLLALEKKRGIRRDHEVFWKKDGSFIPVEYTSHPIVENGETKGAVITFLNIEKRKQMEKDLQKFYIAVEQGADAVFITDTSGIIQYVNPAFETITGFSRKEALGNTPNIIKSGYHDGIFYKEMWSTLLKGDVYRNIVVNKRKSGKTFYADHTITPLKNEKGKVIYFVGMWKDITEQVYEEKRKEEFISMASHELKTPLTSIKVYTQILEKKLDPLNNSQVSKYLERMDTQINKLTGLVSNLLDVSKINAGHLEYSYTWFPLQALVTEIVEDIQATTAHHTIQLNVQSQPRMYGDRDRIGQVLINVLTNAIKYSPKADRVFVQLTGNTSQAIITIRDFGIGIPKEHLDKIFRQFYRIADRDTLYPGLGMGLYITKQIVDRHGGSISVTSSPQEGSTFSIRFPLKKQ